MSILSTVKSSGATITHHFGVCPPRRSVSVFFASLPSRAAQYALCLPIVFLFGKFFAWSTTSTNVPISAPSKVMSANRPDVCGFGPPKLATLVAMMDTILPSDCGRSSFSFEQGQRCVTGLSTAWLQTAMYCTRACFVDGVVSSRHWVESERLSSRHIIKAFGYRASKELFSGSTKE